MHGAEQLAVDVELALAPGAVADPHRGGLPPALEVGQLALGQVPLTTDAEHDLQVAVLHQGAGRRGGHVVDELVRLVRAGRHPQRLDGERRVPDPGVAVVPVPGAPDDLGQRRRGRGTDRTGRLERQRLEHPAAVVDQVSPRTDVRLVQLRPRLPRRHGVVQRRRDLLLAPHLGRRRRRRAGCGAGRSRPAPPHAGTTEPMRRRPVDRQARRARQDQDIGPTGRGEAPVRHVEQREHQAVLGSRDVLDVDLDLALAARHLPQQEMRRVPAQLRARGCPCPWPARRRPWRCPSRSGRSSPTPWCDPGSAGRPPSRPAAASTSGPPARRGAERRSTGCRSAGSTASRSSPAGSPARHCADPTARRSRRSRWCSSAGLLGDDQRSTAGSTSS